MSITKHANWTPATLTAANLPNDAIPFTMTNRDRDTVAIVRCDLERLQRSYREPEGLSVGEASQSDWDAAVAAQGRR